MSFDEAAPSRDSPKSLSNRCSTDWNSWNARETQRKTCKQRFMCGSLWFLTGLV